MMGMNEAGIYRLHTCKGTGRRRREGGGVWLVAICDNKERVLFETASLSKTDTCTHV